MCLRRCGLLRRLVLGMYDVSQYMHCPLLPWLRMTLAAADSCAALLGMYDMAFLYHMPADADADADAVVSCATLVFGYA